MATVRYKGPKKQGMWVLLPIGVRHASGIRARVIANPFVELSDREAMELIKLDPTNFELVTMAGPVVTASTIVDGTKQAEVKIQGKRKRRTKAELASAQQ